MFRERNGLTLPNNSRGSSASFASHVVGLHYMHNHAADVEKRLGYVVESTRK